MHTPSQEEWTTEELSTTELSTADTNRMTLQMIAQAIHDLKQSPGWPHFEKAVQRLMDSCDLKTLTLQDETDLLRITTRQFYKKGLEDALKLVDRQGELLQALRQELETDRV